MRSTGRRLLVLLPVGFYLLCTLFFLSPLIAMTRFAFQGVPMINLGLGNLGSRWGFEGLTSAWRDSEFRRSLWVTLRLAFGTVALTLLLLIPTAIWVRLKLPRWRAFVEFLTVLPYVVPSIALVAGILPLKPMVPWFLNHDASLIPFYTVLALPFSYRSIDAGLEAINLRTLVDAARSLGSGWTRTIVSVLAPNLRTAITSASFLTAAIVLGEYTMARILLKRTLPAFMAQYQGREPQGGMGLALMAIVATAALFGLLSFLTRSRSSRKKSQTTS
jgi:putative spermidine/putrescine transport system permease protein